MTNSDSYCVVFSGALTGNTPADEAKKRFADAFNLNEATVATLFSGEEVVIKKNISRDVALRYAAKINQAGCECAIQSTLDREMGKPATSNTLADEEQLYTGQERRGADRRKRFRRGPRPGAIVPDRRIKKRREEDQDR